MRAKRTKNDRPADVSSSSLRGSGGDGLVRDPLLWFDFDRLVDGIRSVHKRCVAEVGKAVNFTLTVRNWTIGLFIREYEQNGSDRASYGQNLLGRLATDLSRTGMGQVEARDLRRYRQLYLVYPEIWQSLTAELRAQLPSAVQQKWESQTAESPQHATMLMTRLSFTHLVELIAIDDPAKRAFYEVECMKGSWSVRELKRQIGALYFERSGLSKSPSELAARVQAKAEPAEPKLCIRDPYVFEFLGIKSHEAMGESALEDALLDKLQGFLIELGHGFCFEARQKRILLGDTYCFVDLVFYHRVLKCHVLIELKVGGFNHEHLGQLNTYVSWFKRNMMTKGDNPPIGLLLCTDKDHALVEYALADLPNRLFVSKYQLELPTREQIQRFLDAQLGEMNDDV